VIGSGTRVLVTGGTGFIGRHLVHRLRGLGCHVIVADVVLPDQRADVASVRCDLRDRDGTIAAVRDAAPDVVVHLAAHHFLPFCVAHPAEALSLNVLGTQHLLDAVAHSSQCRQFVLASTGLVYAPSDRPHKESDPWAAGNVYEVSKHAAEELVRVAAREQTGVRFVVARLFNVYGPGPTTPHLVPDILSALGTGAALKLGNMETRRDYTYVTDVVDALIRLAGYRGTVRAFNIGTGQGSTARDILLRLERILGRGIRVEVDPAKLRPVDRPALVADPTLSDTELGWKATTPLEDGLRLLVSALRIG
jgi:UDP-glucose 4-epimerase